MTKTNAKCCFEKALNDLQTCIPLDTSKQQITPMDIWKAATGSNFTLQDIAQTLMQYFSTEINNTATALILYSIIPLAVLSSLVLILLALVSVILIPILLLSLTFVLLFFYGLAAIIRARSTQLVQQRTTEFLDFMQLKQQELEKIPPNLLQGIVSLACYQQGMCACPRKK